MADLTAPLHSLRDSLRELAARANRDLARVDRVTRAQLKVNALLQGDAAGSAGDVTQLREITEDVALCDPADIDEFDTLLDRLRDLLDRL